MKISMYECCVSKSNGESDNGVQLQTEVLLDGRLGVGLIMVSNF